MRRISYLMVAVALLCSCTNDAEEKLGGISGTVTDKATSEPIRAAGIRLNTGTKLLLCAVRPHPTIK